jgi:hypothetical protein
VNTNRKKLWKVRIPLKIKIFMWYVYKGVVVTKDNLAKCNWNGSKQCSFCCNDESIQHLFLIVIMLDSCGDYYTLLLVFSLLLTLITCLALGLIVWEGILKDIYLLLLRPFVGQYGLVGIILSLIKLQTKLFCRYYTEERISSGFGHS